MEDKNIIEYNFDRMREVIQNTWLPIMDGLILSEKLVLVQAMSLELLLLL